jgi:secernin
MCDTVVVVADEQVLFAKNSDRDPNEAQLLEWHPRRAHGPGARVRCTWIEIDQVPETNAVLLSRPFWMWGAEIGANEHGVVIGNEAVFTREEYAPSGLTGMDLLRLALERAATAQEAVEVMVDLLERHGQGGGCGHEHRGFTYHNSFIAADAREAVVLETAGRHWAVERVTSGARSISNGLTIPDFAAAHGDRLRTGVSRCRIRQAITQRAGAAAATVSDLMTMLRDHGNGTPAPQYSVISGGMAAPCMHAGGLVASSQTTASWVAQLAPGGNRHWATGTSAPCTGLFKPVEVHEPLDLGAAPDDRFDPRTLWWRHELLHRRAMTDPARLVPLFRDERDALEAAWVADPPSPAAAFAEADRLLGVWSEQVVAAAGRDVRPAWVRRYWRTRDRRAGLATVTSATAAGGAA